MTSENEIEEDELKARSQGQVHRLIDILTQEVSLVDRAANKRRLLVVKRSEDMAKGRKVTKDDSGDLKSDDGNRPHTIPVSGDGDEVSKGAEQLIAEAYKTLSVICSKLEPGKELDEDSYQALDKLRNMFADQSKNASTDDTAKAEAKCAYCSAAATKELVCNDGKKISVCDAHLKQGEKDCEDKHEGVKETVELEAKKADDVAPVDKQDKCEFCDAEANKKVSCNDGTEILCCDKHVPDAQKLAGEKHDGVKSVKSDKAGDVNKSGAKMSRGRRKTFKDAIESLITLLKDVMPEEELSKWPLTAKVSKSADEQKLEDDIAKKNEENKRLREELAKSRLAVGASNVSTVEEVPTKPPVTDSVEWPSDMNSLRD